ncbi:MAG: hypothetical protein JXA16_13770 [Bacteroidales bacterium]|nr:hypothetical protein [Bacteroidales bacterium]
MDLPMIEFACNLFDDGALEDYYIIGAQHILSSTLTMFKSLFKKGLKPENISLLGKCYSTEYEAYFSMKREGIDVSPYSINFDSHESFDESYSLSIREFINKRKDRITSSKYKKIIVLDDGGEMIEAINEMLDDHHNIIGMEQTSSGYRKLQDKHINFPVINMARSKAKLTVETERVISLGYEKFEKHLNNLDNIKKVLILGQGPIGSTIYQHLKDKFAVSRFDLNLFVKSDISHEEFNHKLKEFDLIIGCTGTTSITKEQHQYLKKGVVLVSLSSTDREFDALHLRKKAPKSKHCWHHINCDGIYLMNMGFPISFDSSDDIDDPLFFQFTRSLIMSSIYQALTVTNEKGFVDLDEGLQNMMINKFKDNRILASRNNGTA